MFLSFLHILKHEVCIQEGSSCVLMVERRGFGSPCGCFAYFCLSGILIVSWWHLSHLTMRYQIVISCWSPWALCSSWALASFAFTRSGSCQQWSPASGFYHRTHLMLIKYLQGTHCPCLLVSGIFTGTIFAFLYSWWWLSPKLFHEVFFPCGKPLRGGRKGVQW